MHRLVLSTYLVFLLSLFTTWTAKAGATETFEQIRDDFRPISGMVVKRVGEEFLINLDASQGLSEGDLFAERLVVRGAKGQVLHHYGHPLGKAKAGDSPGGREIREAVAAQRPDVKGSSRELTTLGTLPGAVLMGAFLENEGRLLLAATSGRDIRVYEFTAVPTLVAVGEPTIPGRILSLHWWRPAGDGPLYLALTTEVDENTAYSPVAGKRVAGGIFQLAQDKLTPVREGLSFMLATFDRNFLLGGFGLGSPGGGNALATLSYEKGRFILDESGLEIEGSIQGLAVVGGRILLVVAEPGGSGGAAGKGHLLTTPW